MVAGSLACLRPLFAKMGLADPMSRTPTKQFYQLEEHQGQSKQSKQSGQSRQKYSHGETALQTSWDNESSNPIVKPDLNPRDPTGRV